jgi:hypothetical protein
MANIEPAPVRYNKIGRKQRGLPQDPAKVLAIFHLREIEKLSWRLIGKKLGETRQAPFQLYQRWQDWAKEQNNDDT